MNQSLQPNIRVRIDSDPSVFVRSFELTKIVRTEQEMLAFVEQDGWDLFSYDEKHSIYILTKQVSRDQFLSQLEGWREGRFPTQSFITCDNLPQELVDSFPRAGIRIGEWYYWVKDKKFLNKMRSDKFLHKWEVTSV